MAWQGGFSGVGFETRQQFREWLRKQAKPAYHRVVIHNTDAPYIKPPVTPGQRVKNISVHYKSQGWSAGPDFFVFPQGVYLGSPLGKSVGCKGWNGNSFHVEAEGKYTKASGHDPLTNPHAIKTWENMAWVTAELLEWMAWQADNERIKFHKEGLTTHKGCPGELIEKPWFIQKVKDVSGLFTPTPMPKPALKPVAKPKYPKQIFDMRTIQERLMVHGYKLPKFGADGYPGAETDSAIKAMQKDLHVDQTGLVGPWMWDQLRKEPPAQPVPEQPEPLATPAIPDIKPAPSTPIVAPGQPEPNPAKAMRLLQAQGWPKHWAAGAVAQAQRESYPDLRPWAKGDWILDGKWVKANTPGAVPTAFTIWQLRDDRYDNFLGFAAARGKDKEDFETQVLWCPQELKTSEKLAWKWLQRAETVEQACAAMVWYERPRGYISAKAKAATTWAEVFAVSEKCDGWDVRLRFARALM